MYEVSNNQYPNSGRDHCLSEVVTFLGYEEAACCSSLSVLTGVVLGIFVKYMETPMAKLVTELSTTSCSAPPSCACFAPYSSLALPTVPPASSNKWHLESYSLAVSTILAKTITVVLAFKITTPGRKVREWLLSGAPNSVIPICSRIQVTFCVFWLETSPPLVDVDAHSEPIFLITVCSRALLLRSTFP